MSQVMRGMLADSNGASIVEYALLVSLIAIVALVAIAVLGHGASNLVSSAATSI